MPLLALSLYLFHDDNRLVLVFTFHLRTVNAILLLFLMICALVAHADVNNFLTAFAIALVLEVKPENVGNRYLHLYNLYSVFGFLYIIIIIF
jgi:hypothetical protein